MSNINSTILYKTLKSLPGNEIKAIAKKVRMCESLEISNLFRILSDHIATNHELPRKTCFHLCFGEREKFDDKKLRYLMSEGLNILHKIIIDKQIERDHHQKNLLLLKGLKYYGIEEELHRVTNNALKKIKTEVHQSADYHFYKYHTISIYLILSKLIVYLLSY